MKVLRRQSAFTLIEMLVVIVILGILAGLAVPALKNLGKANGNIGASRQLLDDIGHARQLAMSQRTTVYMVFVPTNFWDAPLGTLTPNTAWFTSLAPAVQAEATNLCDKQLTGYTFMALGALGDQPGNHQWHYLASWQNLPEGAFIAQKKFSTDYTNIDQISGATYPVFSFRYTNNIPFPTETNTVSTTIPPGNLPFLPYIAFNYLGQLVSEVDSTGAYHDANIPLAQGSVLPVIDPAKRTFLLSGSPDVSENPAGNSTNSSYNIIHIDWLTGRATLEFQKVK